MDELWTLGTLQCGDENGGLFRGDELSEDGALLCGYYVLNAFHEHEYSYREYTERSTRAVYKRIFEMVDHNSDCVLSKREAQRGVLGQSYNFDAVLYFCIFFLVNWSLLLLATSSWQEALT